MLATNELVNKVLKVYVRKFRQSSTKAPTACRNHQEAAVIATIDAEVGTDTAEKDVPLSDEA